MPAPIWRRRSARFPRVRYCRLAGAVSSANPPKDPPRLVGLFGPRALPVFVPPWNRFAAEFLPLLGAAGIAGLSAMARDPSALPHGIARIDVHVDLVAWKQDRGFIGAPAALAGLVGQLRARRLGGGDLAAATGILTHHLVMDRVTAGFLDRLIALIDGHGAARWAAVGELLTR